jgi:hypothetical protein
MEVSGQLQTSAALPPTEIAPGTRWIGSELQSRSGRVDEEKNTHVSDC